MSQTILLRTSAANGAPEAFAPGEPALLLRTAPPLYSKLWVGSSTGNRLLLSDDPTDTPYLLLTGGTLSGPLGFTTGNGQLTFTAGSNLHISSSAGPEVVRFSGGNANTYLTISTGANFASITAVDPTDAGMRRPLNLVGGGVTLQASAGQLDMFGASLNSTFGGALTLFSSAGPATLTCNTVGVYIGRGAGATAIANQPAVFIGGAGAQNGATTAISIGSTTQPVVLGRDPVGALEAATRQYVDAADTRLQSQIDLLASNLLFVGGYDADTDEGTYTAASGIPDGTLPDAAAANRSFYVIVTNGGTPPTGGAAGTPLNLGDWLVSDGTQWLDLPIGQADVVASQVAIEPPIGALGPTVQTGLQWLNDNKLVQAQTDARYLQLTGGTLTGNLAVGDGTDGGQQIILNGAVNGLNRTIFWQSGGSPRWDLSMIGAEAGGNIGGNLQIRARSDTGAIIHTPLLITRSTGLATVAGDPTAPLGIATKQYCDDLAIDAGTY